MSSNVSTLYNNGLSIRQVASKVGFSASKVRKMLIAQNTPIRSSSQGLALRKQNSFPLSKEMIQRIEGELLGDGCIKKRSCQSLFAFSNSNPDYVKWLAEKFIQNNIVLTGNGVSKERYYHKNWSRWYVRYRFSTLCSIEFEQMERKWYVARTKVVPGNLKISPKLVLHWFLGDGSLPKKEFAVFCTDNFSFKEVAFLSDKLNAAIGIKSSVMPYQDYYRIFVPKTSVPMLLEYMGDPPFNSMSYKWDLNPIGRVNKYIDIPKEYLYSLYVCSGRTQKELATIFGCSKSTIQKKLYEYQIYKRLPNKIFQIDKNTLLELYIGKGLTIVQVAIALGCSTELVKKLLRTYSIRKKTWRKL